MINEDRLAAACRRNGVSVPSDIKQISVAVIAAMRMCVGIGGMIADQYAGNANPAVYRAIGDCLIAAGEQLKKDAPSAGR